MAVPTPSREGSEIPIAERGGIHAVAGEAVQLMLESIPNESRGNLVIDAQSSRTGAYALEVIGPPRRACRVSWCLSRPALQSHFVDRDRVVHYFAPWATTTMWSRSEANARSSDPVQGSTGSQCWVARPFSKGTVSVDSTEHGQWASKRGGSHRPGYRKSLKKLVAGAGFEPATFGL